MSKMVINNGGAAIGQQVIIGPYQEAHESSPTKIVGNGSQGQETRNVPPFTGISVQGIFQVVVRASSEQKLELRADANVLPCIQAFVRGDVLHLELANASLVSTKLPLEVTLYSPPLKTAKIGGAARFSQRALGTLSLELEGAARADLHGKVDLLTARVSGAGKLKASKLRAREAIVDLSGAARGEVRAVRRLRVRASGASVLVLSGRPEVLDQSISGAASIREA